MFAKRQDELSERAVAEALGQKVYSMFPEVSTLADGKLQGLTVRGLSVSPQKGGSYLAILKVTLHNVDDYPDLWDGYSDGDYVAYGGGTSLWGAVAQVEGELSSGRCRLVPDRYSDNRGKRHDVEAPRKGKKGPVRR